MLQPQESPLQESPFSALRILLQAQDRKVTRLTHDNANEVQAFLDLFDTFFSDCEGVARGDAKGLLSACPPSKNPDEDKCVLGFYEKGKLIGLIDFIRDFPKENAWNIGYFLIHPKYRSGGIGRSIIQQLSEQGTLSQIHTLYCIVQSQNPLALKFWKNCGFEVETERGQHTDVHEYVLKKDLPTKASLLTNQPSSLFSPNL